MNRGADGPAATHPTRPVPEPNTTLSNLAFGCAWASGILAGATWLTMPYPPAWLPWSILIAALAAFVQAIPVRRTPRGMWALWFSAIQCVVWCIIAVTFGRMMEPVPPQDGFGPAVECVLTDAIDLETGVMTPLPIPHPLSENDPERYAWFNGRNGTPPRENPFPWMREHGIDVVDVGNHGLSGIEMRLMDLKPRDWDTMAAVELNQKLSAYFRHLEKFPPPNDSNFGDVRGIYGFKTRKGTLGIIQCLDPGVPLGVRIRYKLVQQAAALAEHSRFPKAAHIARKAGTALVYHDDVDVHYVFFAPKAVGTTDSSSHDTHSLARMDNGTFKLTEQQTFGFLRESTDPYHLKVNGKEHDLRQGRVFVPREDGTLEQLKLFPSLPTAMDPDALSPLIPPVRAMNEEPITEEKFHRQIEAADAQLNDLLKTHAPTHALVVEVRKSEETLREKIQQLKKPTDASAVFGLQAERNITARDANPDGVFGFRFKDNDIVTPPVAVTGHFKDPATSGFTAELKQWMRASNVDMLLHLDKKSYDVLTLDMRDGTAGQRTEWATMLPAQAFPVLAKMEAQNSEQKELTSQRGGCSYRDGLSEVMVFRTRDGMVGYYQLRGVNDDAGNVVEIRFKQVIPRLP